MTDAMARMERQMERASAFTLASLVQLSSRITELEAMLSALVEPAEADADAGDDAVAGPAAATGHLPWPGIAIRPESGEPAASPVEVDCAARMPVCKAVCCKLPIPLSPGEIDAGTVKWDLGHPYIVRRESDGYCTHIERGTGRCGIYADRPGVCRGYSCVKDGRIWKDFDGMVLNQEWLDEHLPAPGFLFIQKTISRRPPQRAG